MVGVKPSLFHPRGVKPPIRRSTRTRHQAAHRHLLQADIPVVVVQLPPGLDKRLRPAAFRTKFQGRVNRRFSSNLRFGLFDPVQVLQVVRMVGGDRVRMHNYARRLLRERSEDVVHYGTATRRLLEFFGRRVERED